MSCSRVGLLPAKISSRKCGRDEENDEEKAGEVKMMQRMLRK